MIAKGGYVYIISNKNRTVLYTGVTSNLATRSYEHKTGQGSDFAKRYQCTDLLYYEFHITIEAAIKREKLIKRWKREWKEVLIMKLNPEMKDLFEKVGEMR